MAQDDFVDLYEVLGLDMDADAENLRKRINELYLEAQRNLDHRNVQKRLSFQQLYELYLPQARHLLLNAPRRAEYDQYLLAYRAHKTAGGTGPVAKAPPDRKEEPSRPHGDLTAPEQKAVSTKRKVRREEDEDPAKLAAEREQLWAKWKGSLEQAFQEESTATTPDAAATAAAATAATTTSHATPRTPAARTQPSAPAQAPAPTQPIVRAQVTRTAGPGARPVTPAATQRTPSTAHAEAPTDGEHSPFAQLHEQERLDLIRAGIETAGIVRGLTVGIVIFLVGCMVIFGVDSYFSQAKQFPLGLSRSMFAIYFLIAVAALALWCGWVASRAARRQASSELSYLSREELLRRHNR